MQIYAEKHMLLLNKNIASVCILKMIKGSTMRISDFKSAYQTMKKCLQYNHWTDSEWLRNLAF